MYSRGEIWTEYVACIVKVRNAYTILVGKPDGRLVVHVADNIKINL
jgi:hypothetical protein